MADDDQPDSLILRMLRSLDNKMDDLGRKLDALQSHSLAMGETLLALRKDIQALDVRVSRIETRFDLREVAPT
jgi:hypothetical protein